MFPLRWYPTSNPSRKLLTPNLCQNSCHRPGNKNMFHVKKYVGLWRNMKEIWRNFFKTQVLGGSLEFFLVPEPWRKLKIFPSPRNMKECEDIWRKYERRSEKVLTQKYCTKIFRKIKMIVTMNNRAWGDEQTFANGKVAGGRVGFRFGKCEIFPKMNVVNKAAERVGKLLI